MWYIAYTLNFICWGMSESWWHILLLPFCCAKSELAKEKNSSFILGSCVFLWLVRLLREGKKKVMHAWHRKSFPVSNIAVRNFSRDCVLPKDCTILQRQELMWILHQAVTFKSSVTKPKCMSSFMPKTQIWNFLSFSLLVHTSACYFVNLKNCSFFLAKINQKTNPFSWEWF